MTTLGNASVTTIINTILLKLENDLNSDNTLLCNYVKMFEPLLKNLCNQIQTLISEKYSDQTHYFNLDIDDKQINNNIKILENKIVNANKNNNYNYSKKLNLKLKLINYSLDKANYKLLLDTLNNRIIYFTNNNIQLFSTFEKIKELIILVMIKQRKAWNLYKYKNQNNSDKKTFRYNRYRNKNKNRYRNNNKNRYRNNNKDNNKNEDRNKDINNNINNEEEFPILGLSSQNNFIAPINSWSSILKNKNDNNNCDNDNLSTVNNNEN